MSSYSLRSAERLDCAQMRRFWVSSSALRDLEESDVELLGDAGGGRDLVLPGAVRDEAPRGLRRS